MNELATIAEYDIPVKIAIMNDLRQQIGICSRIILQFKFHVNYKS